MRVLSGGPFHTTQASKRDIDLGAIIRSQNFEDMEQDQLLFLGLIGFHLFLNWSFFS